MSSIDLSINPGYVQSWTYLEAIREIFQNALDQETQDSENKFFFEYDIENSKLLIGSKSSKLERKSLLLGASTKSDDAKTIGKFGEGYKLALLVLTRENLPVVIKNYGAKELWTPSIKYSSQYECDILNIDIHRYIFKSVPDYDLVFEIQNITNDMYLRIREQNLHLAQYPENIVTDFGNILTHEDYRGKVFINGLYVDKISEENVKYGYDVRPAYLDLDRDRRMVKSFDLFWVTSKMWNNTLDGDLIGELFEIDSPEVEYLTSHYNSSISIADSLHSSFILKHGANATPVSNQEELEKYKGSDYNINPVIVSGSHASMIRRSSHYVAPIKTTPNKSPYEELVEFEKSCGLTFDGDTRFKWSTILEKSKNWIKGD